MGSFWSFPDPPPSKRLSGGALAIVPLMFAALVWWEVIKLLVAWLAG
jgi:hypothetical protein